MRDRFPAAVSMRRRVAMVLAGLFLAGGCSAAPTEAVVDGGDAPTGIGIGPTLYFLEGNALRPVTEASEGTVNDIPYGRLGDVRSAVQRLTLGTGDNEGLRTEVPELGKGLADVKVRATGDVITIVLPSYDLSPLATDQMVCTALAVNAARGGTTRGTTVDILLHHELGDKIIGRTCPVVR